MAYLVVALGALMALAGAYAMYTGSGLIQVEQGWSAFIAGAVLLSGGFVTASVGLLIRALGRLQPGQRPAAAFPDAAVAEPTIAAPAAVPATVLAGTALALHGAAEPPRDDAGSARATGRGEPEPAIGHPLDLDAQRDEIQNERRRSETQPAEAAPVEAHAFEPVYEEPRHEEPRHEEPRPHEPTVLEHQAYEHAVQADAPPTAHEAIEASPGSEPWLDRLIDEHFPDGISPSPRAVEPPAAPVEATWLQESGLHEETTAVAHVEQPPTAPDLPEPLLVHAAEDHQAVQHEPAEAPEPVSAPAQHEPASASAVTQAPEAPAPAVIGRYEAEGTSYVMYADGSIEAQSAAGVYRFASMTELKEFIES